MRAGWLGSTVLLMSCATTLTAENQARVSACEQRDGGACYRLGDAYTYGTGAPLDTQLGLTYRVRACDLGSVAACADFMAWSGDPHRQLAERKLSDLCHAGQGEACFSILDQQRGCELGYFPSCEELGGIRERANDPLGAVGAYERACELGGSRSCCLAAKYYEKDDRARADKLNERAHRLSSGCLLECGCHY